jgi:hypothetical protein
LATTSCAAPMTRQLVQVRARVRVRNGRAAVHGMCGSRDPWGCEDTGDGCFAPDRLIGHGHTDEGSGLARCARVRVCACEREP